MPESLTPQITSAPLSRISAESQRAPLMVPGYGDGLWWESVAGNKSSTRNANGIGISARSHPECDQHRLRA